MNSTDPAHLHLGIAAFGTDGARSGIGSYLRQWFGALDPDGAGVDVDVLAPASEMDELVPAGLHCERVVKSDSLRSAMRSVMWHQAALPLASKRAGWDVAFFPAANRRLPAWMPCPTVGTVHDMSMARVKGKYDRTHEAYFHTVLPALIRRLDQVVTVSNCSKRDIVELADVDPARVHVIPHGVDSVKFHPDDDDASRAIRAGLGLEQPYLLYVSRIEHPGKNHVSLIRAFDRVKARLGAPHQLVLAGSPWNGAEDVYAEAAAAKAASDIRFTGFTSAEALPAIYRGAESFVFPSLYEGFGMPLLEAMASGVPVACSRASSLPEVAGDAAEFFEPTDVESIEASLEALMGDPERRADLRARGLRRAATFTWRQSVNDTLAVFRQAVAEAS